MGIQPVSGGFTASVGGGFGGGEQPAQSGAIPVRMGSGRYEIEQSSGVEVGNSCGRGCMQWLRQVWRAIRDFFSACGSCFRGRGESFDMDPSGDPTGPEPDPFHNVLEGFWGFAQSGGVLIPPPEGVDMYELINEARYAGRPMVANGISSPDSSAEGGEVDAWLAGRQRSHSLPAVTSTDPSPRPLTRSHSASGSFSRSTVRQPVASSSRGVSSPESLANVQAWLAGQRSQSLPELTSTGPAPKPLARWYSASDSLSESSSSESVASLPRSGSSDSIDRLQREASISFETKVRISQPSKLID